MFILFIDKLRIYFLNNNPKLFACSFFVLLRNRGIALLGLLGVSSPTIELEHKPP